MPQTIYDKIWNDHLVHQQEDGTSLLFVDIDLMKQLRMPIILHGINIAIGT